MIRYDRILSNFKGGTLAVTLAVGFRQTGDSEGIRVTGINLLSASGLYFNEISAVVNTSIIQQLQSIVSPSVQEFNEYLTLLHDSIVLEVCEELVLERPSLVDAVNLFPFEKSIATKVDIVHQFVGFEVNPSTNIDICGKVVFAEILFDGIITSNLYLFNSNSSTYLKKKAFTTVANKPTVVEITDWFIADEDNHKGGKFYIGYYSADLSTSKPYAKSTGQLQLFNKPRLVDFKYIGMDGATETIDISTKEYLFDTFGINLGVEVYNDYTETLIRNKGILYPIIQYKMVEKVLNLIKFSIRTNRIKNLTKDMIDDINFELYGNKDLGIEGVSGKLLKRLDNAKAMLFNEQKKTNDAAV